MLGVQAHGVVLEPDFRRFSVSEDRRRRNNCTISQRSDFRDKPVDQVAHRRRAVASVKKRDDGQWRARYRDTAGKEHSRHFGRRVDAQAWLDAVTTAVQTGTYTDPRRGRVSVGEWSARWLDGQVHLKPSTHERYAGILREHVVPRWRDVRLADVEHSAVQAWLSGLAARRSRPRWSRSTGSCR